jgi:transcriptional regulator with XRE-family HTH domain
MELGEILRGLREERRISIVNLAEAVGVSSSHISQIERNLSSPSISMLRKIAQVLDVPITYFFQEENKTSSVIKKADRRKLILPDSNLTYELLSPSVVKDFQLLLTRIEIGGQMNETTSIHGGAECCYIKKGKVEFIVNGERNFLEEGDSIYYPENTPHNVINIGDVEAIIISVISPADF